jgi:large conductance mechanosensitive channel
MGNTFKGFKDFLLRGNILELAVSFVIGLAFVALIGAFCAAFVLPIINTILGGGVSGGKVKLSDGQYLDFGLFLNAVIVFVLTAAVLYFVFVLPLNTLRERRARGDEPAEDTELDLLREIRDSLNRDGLNRG